jgi:hypothetical protein
MKHAARRSTARWTTRLALGAWAAAFAVVVFGSACSSVDATAVSPLALPDRDQYINQGVSTFMEKRCGALDCHGQVGRPLRIYSANGLRKNLVKGARDVRGTQPDELLDNYYATVGLEPEEISRSRVTEGAFTDFLLLKKPLSIEGGGVRHKGGPVLRSTDPGFECLITWISGAVNKAKCEDGIIQ